MNTSQDHRPIARIIRRTPVTLPAGATVQQACALMQRERIGAILVTDAAERLAGIFTGRDAVRLLAAGRNAAHSALRDVMTPNPVHLPPEQTAIHALRLMQDGGFRHIPVVDCGAIVGLVSHGDFRHHEWDRLDEETGFWERL